MVVLAGHSAGGQFVQRYAVAGRAPTMLSQHGIHTRFVVANPSSYLYFDTRRPTNTALPLLPDALPWLRPLSVWPGSAQCLCRGPTPQALMARYARQQVIYLLGTLDADATHPFLDRSCAAKAQGPTRLARGQAYYQYLPVVLGHEVMQRQHQGIDRRRGTRSSEHVPIPLWHSLALCQRPVSEADLVISQMPFPRPMPAYPTVPRDDDQLLRLRGMRPEFYGMKKSTPREIQGMADEQLSLVAAQRLHSMSPMSWPKAWSD